MPWEKNGDVTVNTTIWSMWELQELEPQNPTHFRIQWSVPDTHLRNKCAVEYRMMKTGNGKRRKILNTLPLRPISAVIHNTSNEVKGNNVKSESSHFFWTSQGISKPHQHWWQPPGHHSLQSPSHRALSAAQARLDGKPFSSTVESFTFICLTVWYLIMNVCPWHKPSQKISIKYNSTCWNTIYYPQHTSLRSTPICLTWYLILCFTQCLCSLIWSS